MAYNEDRPSRARRQAGVPSARTRDRHTNMTLSATKSSGLRVAAARDLGPMFVDNPHCMVGQDGAFSIPLKPGQALWFFGDTLIGKRFPGESLWYRDGNP